MPTYETSQHPGGDTYDVHVIGAQGTRQTMLGFRTKEEAEVPSLKWWKFRVV
jgi:hypothetical protein